MHCNSLKYWLIQALHLAFIMGIFFSTNHRQQTTDPIGYISPLQYRAESGNTPQDV
jgi:hypothetical protein